MNRGWFAIPGVQDGDRGVMEQINGVQHVVDCVRGRTLLDLGSAEGLISRWLCLEGGAVHSDCVELMPSRCDKGRHLCGDAPVAFHCDDVAQWVRKHCARRYDVVLVLSIAHKLRRPDEFLRTAASMARELVVVRTPEPVVCDPRSDNREYSIIPLMQDAGFACTHNLRGSRNEWVGTFRRLPATRDE